MKRWHFDLQRERCCVSARACQKSWCMRFVADWRARRALITRKYRRVLASCSERSQTMSSGAARASEAAGADLIRFALGHFGARACQKSWRMRFVAAWRARRALITRKYRRVLASCSERSQTMSSGAARASEAAGADLARLNHFGAFIISSHGDAGAHGAHARIAAIFESGAGSSCPCAGKRCRAESSVALALRMLM